MADISEEKVHKYISDRVYIKKNGEKTINSQIHVYKPTGAPPGRKRTTESILLAEIRKLTEDEQKKVSKYVTKIKERRKDESE